METGFVLMTPVGELPSLAATLTQLRAVNKQGEVKEYWFDTRHVLKRLLEASFEEELVMSNGAKVHFTPSAWGDTILVRYEQRDLSFWIDVKSFVNALRHVLFEHGVMNVPVPAK